MADANDELESVIEPTEEVENTEEVEETVVETETEDEAQEESQDSELVEKNKKLFERAKKAEAELKEFKAKAQAPTAKPTPEKQGDLSSMDTIALIGAQVTVKEDIDEVVDFARVKGISIDEALAHNVVKAILKDKAEVRQTAAATNTGTARRSSSKPTNEQVLANVASGKLPDDPEALAEARMASRFNK
jgi:hypothetical protein